MEPFAQVEAVQRRLDFALDEEQQRAVTASLEDMSNEARFLADKEWPEPEDAPHMVRVQVIKAVTRWAKNMQGLVTSRAGDETLTWSDLGEEAIMPHFTAREERVITTVANGRAGEPFFGTAEIVAHGPRRVAGDHGYRETVGGGNKPFPFDLPDGQVW